MLKATADAAGTEDGLATQARLLASLARHARGRAPAIALHVTRQTLRTVRSSSAYQQYWTGVVKARDVFGKFTFVPTAPVVGADTIKRGPRHLTDDWRSRQSRGPLEFGLEWIPFLSDRETPLDDLTRPWRDDHKMRVGRVTFPQLDQEAAATKLIALLASELGANPGNWQETPEQAPGELPATRFTAARFLCYRASQKHRGALPDERYAAFFERGEISPDLARELVRRYAAKRSAGHWVPEIGDLAIR